jgi:hypothetical protein
VGKTTYCLSISLHSPSKYVYVFCSVDGIPTTAADACTVLLCPYVRESREGLHACTAGIACDFIFQVMVAFDYCKKIFVGVTLFFPGAGAACFSA